MTSSMGPKFEPKPDLTHAHFQPSGGNKVGNLGGKPVIQHADDIGIRPSATGAAEAELPLRSHKFTNPQIDKTMETFANDLVKEFSPIKPVSLGYSSLEELKKKGGKEEQKYVTSVQKALSLPDRINEQFKIDNGRGLELKEKEFVNDLVDTLGSSLDKDEFLAKLKNLTQNQKFPEAFLKGLFDHLKKHKEEIDTLREARGSFESSYKKGLSSAERLHHELQSAFYGEEKVMIDPQTKLISVPLSQFRLAMQLFNKEFGWMTKYACSEEDQKLTAHLFANLLFGENAPPLAELPDDLSCFAIKESTDVAYTQQFKLEENEAAISSILKFMENDLQAAASIYVQDNINYVLQDMYKPGFFNKKSLQQPLLDNAREAFVDDLIQHPDKIASLKKSGLLQAAKNRNDFRSFLNIFDKFLENNPKVSESTRQTIADIRACATHFPSTTLKKLDNLFPGFSLTDDELKMLFAIKILEMLAEIPAVSPVLKFTENDLQLAASAFVQDNIKHVGEAVLVNGTRFEPGFLNNKDLEKPFFLESVRQDFIDDLIENPSKVASMKQSNLLRMAKAYYGTDFLGTIFKNYLHHNPKASESTRLMIKKILSCATLTPEILKKMAESNLNPKEIETLLALKILKMIIVINQAIPKTTAKAMEDVLNPAIKGWYISLDATHHLYTVDPRRDRVECQGTLLLTSHRKLLTSHRNNQNVFLREEKLISAQLNFNYTIPSLEGTEPPKASFYDLVFSPFASVSLIDLLAEQLGQKIVKDQTADAMIKRYTLIIKTLENIEKTFKDETGISPISKLHIAFEAIKAFKRLSLKSGVEQEKMKELQQLHEDLVDEVNKAWVKALAHYKNKPQVQELLVTFKTDFFNLYPRSLYS